jgi:hypothetical protein
MIVILGLLRYNSNATYSPALRNSATTILGRHEMANFTASCFPPGTLLCPTVP